MSTRKRRRTDNVRDVQAIREPPRGPVSRIVNAVRGRVGARGGGQVVVVATIDERIAEHEERAGRLGSRHGDRHENRRQQCDRKSPGSTNAGYSRHVWGEVQTDGLSFLGGYRGLFTLCKYGRRNGMVYIRNLLGHRT